MEIHNLKIAARAAQYSAAVKKIFHWSLQVGTMCLLEVIVDSKQHCSLKGLYSAAGRKRVGEMKGGGSGWMDGRRIKANK
jgi:hypothetical protein